jgi:hypothetical protein
MKNIIKKILKEEVDDWEWAKGPVNPWLEYDAIEFDVVPKKEDVQHYIELFLSIKYEFNNRNAWVGDNTISIKSIIASVISGKPSILGFEEYYFFYGPKDSWDEDLKTIKYSDLIGSSLTESDDMDWIRDIYPRIPQDYIPKIGSKMICVHGYKDYWDDDGTYTRAQDDPNYGGSGYREGKIIIVGRVSVHENSERNVVWPSGGGSGIYVDALAYFTDPQ